MPQALAISRSFATYLVAFHSSPGSASGNLTLDNDSFAHLATGITL